MGKKKVKIKELYTDIIRCISWLQPHLIPCSELSHYSGYEFIHPLK